MGAVPAGPWSRSNTARAEATIHVRRLATSVARQRSSPPDATKNWSTTDSKPPKVPSAYAPGVNETSKGQSASQDSGRRRALIAGKWMARSC